MLYKMEQLKWLEVDGEETYKFVGKGKATAKEIENLIIMDETSVDLYGFHLITNYEDLKGGNNAESKD